MASKRRNTFYENKKQGTTEIVGVAGLRDALRKIGRIPWDRGEFKVWSEFFVKDWSDGGDIEVLPQANPTDSMSRDFSFVALSRWQLVGNRVFHLLKAILGCRWMDGRFGTAEVTAGAWTHLALTVVFQRRNSANREHR
ncbi:hypothetical protein AAG570_005637 [Ranatra chinensis]|uniref:Uncharacterized protein n=1 Tax=Ranatra chinensis TaxID=642074 RepID=A0ABD0XYZ6_9HEMI